MEWTEVLLALLGGTTVGGIYEAVKYRKQNKALKEAEAKNADTDAQGGQIDLANKYFDGMLDMLEKVRQSQDKGNDNQTEMLVKLDTLNARMGNMETYLNGDYKHWLEKQKEGVGNV